jgi:hypothetical protein
MQTTLKLFPAYGQFGIWDKEDKNSYPQFSTGDEKFIKGKKGIVFSIIPNHEIELKVLDNKPEEENKYTKITHAIEIGREGLLIGGVEVDKLIPIKAGKYNVSVFFIGNQELSNTFYITLQ